MYSYEEYNIAFHQLRIRTLSLAFVLPDPSSWRRKGRRKKGIYVMTNQTRAYVRHRICAICIYCHSIYY